MLSWRPGESYSTLANEGLGSLYEHTDLDSGDLRGRINWRLPELKKAIADGKTIPLEELFAKGRAAFYLENRRGLYYAMSRYLLYYLQERGLLEKYYHQFVDNQEQDPTGLATLQDVLGEKRSEGFSKEMGKEHAGVAVSLIVSEIQ